MIIELHVTHLNHPETIPPRLWSMERLSSMKWVPGTKKIGDCCSRKLCVDPTSFGVPPESRKGIHLAASCVQCCLGHGHTGSRGIFPLWECTLGFATFENPAEGEVVPHWGVDRSKISVARSWSAGRLCFYFAPLVFLSSYVDELYFGSEHEEVKCVCIKMCVCVCTHTCVQRPTGTYKHILAVVYLLILGSGKLESSSHSTLLLEILVNTWYKAESVKWVLESERWLWYNGLEQSLSGHVVSFLGSILSHCPFTLWAVVAVGSGSDLRGSPPEAPGWPRALPPQAEPLSILCCWCLRVIVRAVYCPGSRLCPF